MEIFEFSCSSYSQTVSNRINEKQRSKICPYIQYSFKSVRLFRLKVLHRPQGKDDTQQTRPQNWYFRQKFNIRFLTPSDDFNITYSLCKKIKDLQISKRWPFETDFVSRWTRAVMKAKRVVTKAKVGNDSEKLLQDIGIQSSQPISCLYLNQLEHVWYQLCQTEPIVDICH